VKARGLAMSMGPIFPYLRVLAFGKKHTHKKHKTKKKQKTKKHKTKKTEFDID